MSKARSRARRLAMQSLYEWQIADNTPSDILSTYLNEHDLKSTDKAYFETLLLGVSKHQSEIDTALTPHLARPLDEVDPIELAILRLACYELIHHLDVPYRVVLNEAIELAKQFGAESGHRFVNGILDRVATEVRAMEVKLKKS